MIESSRGGFNMTMSDFVQNSEQAVVAEIMPKEVVDESNTAVVPLDLKQKEFKKYTKTV